MLQQQNSKLQYVGAQVSRRSWMTSHIIFSLIRFWSEYFEDQKLIFTKMNKEDHRMILGDSNLKDWIIFGRISMEDKYSIMMVGFCIS